MYFKHILAFRISYWNEFLGIPENLCRRRIRKAIRKRGALQVNTIIASF